ncbi:MAG: 8-oxo-dGTP diphosphatase [Clostridia bacterium]|nr:8-oxo-dGTP diphosphatase [Clostridia bacterium]
MTEKAIFTNMCMIYDRQGNILVEERRKNDWRGIAFPGGHVEEREAFGDSVIREIKEETGLDIKHPLLCGVKQFYTDEGERYVVFLYKTNEFSGELASSEEGRVFWIKREELCSYPLAADFEALVRVFEEAELSEFFCYEENGKYSRRII